MIVVDASAMVEALIGGDVDESLLAALAGDLAAPHLLDIEVLAVLRGLSLSRKLPPALAETARAHHFALMVDRHETAPLSPGASGPAPPIHHLRRRLPALSRSP